MKPLRTVDCGCRVTLLLDGTPEDGAECGSGNLIGIAIHGLGPKGEGQTIALYGEDTTERVRDLIDRLLRRLREAKAAQKNWSRIVRRGPGGGDGD